MEISTIKKCFNYNPKTGELFYSQNSPINKGQRITRKYVTINKEKISCTKVMYALIKDVVPSFALGFIDGDNTNWVWTNIGPTSKIISKRQAGRPIKSKIEKMCIGCFDNCMNIFLAKGFANSVEN